MCLPVLPVSPLPTVSYRLRIWRGNKDGEFAHRPHDVTALLADCARIPVRTDRSRGAGPRMKREPELWEGTCAEACLETVVAVTGGWEDGWAAGIIGTSESREELIRLKFSH